MRWSRVALVAGALLCLILAGILGAVAVRDVDATRSNFGHEVERVRLVEQALLAGMYVQRMQQLESAMYAAPVWKDVLAAYERAREDYMAAFGYVVARRLDLPKLKLRLDQAVNEGRILQDYSAQVAERAWIALEQGTPLAFEPRYQDHDKLTEYFHQLQDGLKAAQGGAGRLPSDLRLEQSSNYMRSSLLLVELATLLLVALSILYWWKRRKPAGSVRRNQPAEENQAWLSAAALQRVVSERLANGGAYAQPCALLVVQLANGPQVTQAQGGGMAEQLVRKWADRLHRSLPREDSVGRLGGYEFAVFLSDADSARAHRVASRLAQVLVKSTVMGHVALYPSVRIGGAVAPQDGGDVDTLLNHARTALSGIGSGGSQEPYAFYAPTGFELAADSAAVNPPMMAA
jgi:diguanylate cyclase (GGDEF)-like protein